MRSLRRVVPISPEFPTGYAEDEAQDFADIAAFISPSEAPPPPQETVVHLTLAIPAGAELITTLCPSKPFIQFADGTVRPLVLGARVLCITTAGTWP